MPHGQQRKPDQRIACSVGDCEFNYNSEECTLDGIHVDINEQTDPHAKEHSLCGSYKPHDNL